MVRVLLESRKSDQDSKVRKSCERIERILKNKSEYEKKIRNIAFDIYYRETYIKEIRSLI